MSRLGRTLLQLCLLAGLLLWWESAARRGAVSSLFFPAPLVIARASVDAWSDGSLSSATGATLLRLLAGLLLGAGPGAVFGLAIGRSSALRQFFDPIVAAIYPIPKIAVLPLMMVVLGVGEASKIAAIALAAFFPMFINSVAAVREIPSRYFEVVRAYGGRRKDVFFHVVLPASEPVVLAGLRIAANASLVTAISIELVAADSGLGHMLWLSWQTLRIEGLYATLVVIALIGIGINSLLHLAERALPWSNASNSGVDNV